MWPSYVINLARNTRRMENSARQFDAANLPWERIDAVNGWDLPEHEVARVYDATRNARDGKQPLVAPEIGCYLSHIAAWERIAEGTHAGGFIFEDDFAADDTLGEKLELLSAPQDDWDMVKLFSFDADAPLVWDRPLGPYRIGMPYRVPTCLIGYGLTRDAAARLAARARPFFRPVDEDQKFVWETGLRVALVLPPPILVGDQSTVTGTIGNERREGRTGGTLARGLHNLRYSLRYSWNLARHRHRERRAAERGRS
jgi:glycosyl transferase family 25